MNRLQKKCFIASTGCHALLALILVVGPGFLSSSKPTLDLELVNFDPKILTDSNMQGGGTPAPKPPPSMPPQAQPPIQKSAPPSEPKQEKVREPQPKQEPKTEPIKEPKQLKADPDALEPKPDKKHKIDISTAPIHRTQETKKATKIDTEAEQRAQEEKQFADRRRRAADQIRMAANNINTSSKTAVEEVGPGGGGPAYASYAAWVKTKYDRAWIAPEDSSTDQAAARVSVTIANDGTVLSARIIQSSGDSQVDRSVQRALDSVTFIAPFPEGAKEKQRTYNINFSVKAKRGTG